MPLPVDVMLLDRLLRTAHGVTVESLAREMGVTSTDILRRIESLREAGCVIDAHPQQGVRLVSTGLGCWADYIEPRHGGGLGRKLVVYRETASTQDAAKALLASGTHAGTVVVADHQTGGRGRLGRRWFAPPGSSLLLTAMIALPPREGSMTTDRLMLASCCAIAQTLESLALAPQVRWPNDVLVGDRKIAGILIETTGGAAMIGLGLNVGLRETDLPPADGSRPVHATSLAMLGCHADRLLLLDGLLGYLDAALHRRTDDDLHEEWRRRSCLLQQRVTVEHDGRRVTGRVIDVDPRHGLLLTDDRGAAHTLPAATTSLVWDGLMG